MSVVLPDPLGSAAEYIAAIKQLDNEIAQAEKHLGRLRRMRGCRILQLQQLEPGADLRP